MTQLPKNTSSKKIRSRANLKLKKSAETEHLPKNPRLYFLTALILILAVLIISKLYFLQVVSYAYYKTLADDQHSVWQKLIPKRGEIYLEDKDGLYPVAVNKDVQMAYAVPKEIEDPISTATKVADALGLDKDLLTKELGNSDGMYQVLKHKLSDAEVQKIDGLKLKGIYLTDETLRYYPAGELAAQVLGFEGWKGNDYGGRYGLELYLDSQLRGQEGSLYNQTDNAGNWIALGDKEVNYAKDGDSFALTIDSTLQYESEKILAAAVEKYQAQRGSVIIMETATGKILSMADYPTFDPNDYASTSDMSAFRNLAVSDPYECGSVFKAITMASAIDAGKITPDTTYVDPGEVQDAGFTIRNAELKAYGLETMTQVLDKSLNTGAIFAEKALGNDGFADYVKRFGFGDTTGVDLYGEAAGDISNLSNLRSDIQFYTASFGQGITVTPIQLISAYNAIANGGILMKPQVIEKIVHPDGTTQEVEPQVVRRVISEQTALEVSKMLRDVVVNGMGKSAGVPGYLVAGKTGTAQVASSSARGYQDGETIGSFAGFVPEDNPKYTVLVRIDNPKGVLWAESSAAPTFGELMKFLLDYENVAPTETYTQHDLDTFSATHTLSSDFIQKDQSSSSGNNSAANITTTVNNTGDKKE